MDDAEMALCKDEMEDRLQVVYHPSGTIKTIVIKAVPEIGRKTNK